MEILLNEIIENNRHLIKNGKVADYIPALAKADFEKIGVTVAGRTGALLYSAGDYNQKFTLQSISKVISFLVAAMDNGIEDIFEKVGCDSTDEPFNAFTKLDLPNVNKPANPLINSGAILTTSMIKGNGDEKFQKILELTRRMAHNPNIGYNEEVYLSEKKTGSRNRSMAYLMSSKNILEGDVEDVLDTYFKQCSIEVDTRDLAKIGRFISAGCEGINIDGISRTDMSILLKGLLFTCGMYNYSARYAIEVGIPSKSGVGGGIMGVLPNGMGIGIFSPALDENGNSSAGIGIIKELTRRLHYNIFDDRKLQVEIDTH
ncbi:glutaminase A [Gudongella sp. DL1XJH-153]|uniref:glutaminase A n=1 Tax=Gudongella sp. DL1XJH-153 TaxID=3409804 RepID=UPI003BB4D999